MIAAAAAAASAPNEPSGGPLSVSLLRLTDWRATWEERISSNLHQIMLSVAFFSLWLRLSVPFITRVRSPRRRLIKRAGLREGERGLGQKQFGIRTRMGPPNSHIKCRIRRRRGQGWWNERKDRTAVKLRFSRKYLDYTCEYSSYLA